MTLLETAEQAGLSHSFLSQIEHGRARPSFDSLNLIALALGVSRAEVTAGATAAVTDVLQSAEPEGAAVSVDEHAQQSAAPGSVVLHQEDSPFTVLRVSSKDPAPGRRYVHPEAELVYVLAGRLQIALADGVPVLLEAGASITYRGGTPHRWCAADEAGYEALLVKMNPLDQASASAEAQPSSRSTS